MKKLTIFLILVPCLCFSQIKTFTFEDWEIQQQKEIKRTIIHIYTDWCAVCKIESFQINKNKELVRIINDNFYFINFEAEKTKQKKVFQGKEFNYLPNGNSGIHELALALSKNKNQPVYPLWIILNENQELVYYYEGQFKANDLKEKLDEISKF